MISVELAGGRLRASRLGFGTSTLHHLPTERARADLLSHCFDRGLRYFDTAPLYGHELAERQLGRFARSRRSELVLATKFGIEPHPWMARSPALLYAGMGMRAVRARLGLGVADWRRDYSGASMLRSLERSLKNLQTDRLDILFAHDPAASGGDLPDDWLRSWERIREQGKARFLGISGAAADCLRFARRYPSIVDVLQVDAGEEVRQALPSAADPLEQAGWPADVTFGHFRRAVARQGGDGGAVIGERLRTAVASNPRGVILFSSRSAARVDQVLTACSEIERWRERPS